MQNTKPIQVFWGGEPPRVCDICRRKIGVEFIDGATVRGPWAIMDPNCHKTFGVGLGVGLGQRYRKQPSGRWLRVEG